MPIEQQHPALERIVSPGQEVEELASGFGNDMGPAEGPLWWHEGGYLLLSDIGNNRRIKWAPGAGASVVQESTNGANGLTRDNPLAPLVDSCTTLAPAPGAHFMRRLLPISLNRRYPPSCHHSGPSAGPMSLPKPLANSSTSCPGDTIRSKAGCCCSMGMVCSFSGVLSGTRRAGREVPGAHDTTSSRSAAPLPLEPAGSPPKMGLQCFSIQA